MPLLAALAILAGGVGNLTLLQATAVTDRWSTTHYGRLSGLLGAPTHIAAALACTSALATFLTAASAAKPHPVSGAHPG
ncbi:hypothetical protein ACE1OC_23960 [Streptomyces sp. DSM 116496]|uniref:hypothetical protein n=1 Tax=Streptomyces stoeckheimensis TaxID=3344656 RepID=UPI0038B39242